MSRELLIFTKKIHDNAYHETFSFSYKELDFHNINFIFIELINLNININLASKEFVFRCDIQTQIKKECDNCLKEIKIKINIKDFIFSHKNSNQDTIDITPDIRDAILLQLPSKTLCSSNCKGICFKCKKKIEGDNCDCQRAIFNNPFSGL